MFLCRFDHRRVTFFVQTDDVDQSVLSSVRYELVADKQIVRSKRYQNGIVEQVDFIVILLYCEVGKSSYVRNNFSF